MNRRELFQSAASVTAGAALFAADPDAVMGASRNARAVPERIFAAPFIETRDRAGLFYRDWGTGKAVVFVHSWAVHSDLWQYQMVHLSEKGLRCVAYDRRGHGRSTDPGRGYDFDTLADDLATVIEKLDLREITLVGHSMGCAEIVRYVSRHGFARVARIAFVSPSLPFALKTADNPDGTDQNVFEKVRAGWSKDFPKWLGENARPFFAPDTSAEMVAWGIRLCQYTSLQAIVECSRIQVETDFRPELPKIGVPTLVVHGDADVSAPLELTGRKTAQLIPGSQLRVYARGPHGLMFTHTDRLNSDLLAFVNS
jgi:non-heme chloroperoxidase